MRSSRRRGPFRPSGLSPMIRPHALHLTLKRPRPRPGQLKRQRGRVRDRASRRRRSRRSIRTAIAQPQSLRRHPLPCRNSRLRNRPRLLYLVLRSSSSKNSNPLRHDRKGNSSRRLILTGVSCFLLIFARHYDGTSVMARVVVSGSRV